VANSAASMGKSLTNVGRSLSGTGMAMSRNITLPLVAAGGAAAKLALDFDTSMRQIVALTDVTADQIGGIKDQILELGADVGKGPQELAEAFYFVASAGFEAEEAMAVLETAARASAAGMGQTQDVAKVLGATINAYGAENITAAEAADQLQAAVGKGSAEAADFAAVIGRVVPVAATMGVTFDEVTAALAAMTNVGIDADTAATSLRQVMVSLLKPTTQAEDALREMGLSSAGLRQQLQEEGLLATLRTLEERFAGNSAATATVFGNVRALTGVTALLRLEQEKLDGIFAATADSTGALAQAYEDTEGPGRELGRSMSRIQGVAISLGDDVLPLVASVLEEVAKAAEGLGDWWSSLDEDTQKLIVQVLAFVAVTGPMLIIVGKLAMGLGVVFKAVGFLLGAKGIPALIKVMGGLRLATLGFLGPVGLLIGASVLLGEGLKELEKSGRDMTKVIDRLATSTDRAAKEIKHDIISLADDMGISMDRAGLAVENAMERLGLSFDEAVDHIRETWKSVPDDITFADTDRKLQREARGIVTGATDELANLPPEARAILEAAGYDIGEGAETAMAGIEEEAIKAREAAIDQMEAMLDGIASLFESDETLQDAFQALLDRMADPYTEAERKADIFSTNTIAIIRGALKTGDPLIVSDTRDLVNRMLGEFALMEPGVLEVGRGVPPAIRAGMDKEIGALITYLEKEHGIILEELTLAEAEQLGLDGIFLYAQGIKARAEMVRREAATVAARAINELDQSEASATVGESLGYYYGQGISVRPNLDKARTAGGQLADSAKKAMWWDSYLGGRSIGLNWGAGLSSAFTTVERDLGFRMGEIRALLGGSLPTEGPLQHPETGGRSIAEAWGGALIGGLDKVGGEVNASMAALAGGLSPTFAPAFAGMAGPRASAVSPVLPSPLAASVKEGDVIVNLQGILPVRHVEDVAYALRDVRNGTLRPNGRRER
jgi:TP901 family phage tail tape measure protein